MPIGRRINFKITHIKFWIPMCFIILISFIRTVSTINIPVIIHLCFILFMVLICSKEELIACMCCLLPMLGIMQNGIALLIVSAGVFVRLERIRMRAIIPLLLMVILEFLHINQSHLRLYGFLQNFVSLIALTILLMDNSKENCDFGFIVRAFAYIVLVCSFINILACTVQNGYSILSFERLGNLNGNYEDFRGLINPNVNSYICLIALCMLLLLRNKKNEKRSDKYVIVAIIMTILLTQSKSAILCVVLAYIFYTFFSGCHGISYRKIARGGFVLVAIVFFCVFFSDLIHVLIARFKSGDFSTGRTSISLFYFRHIMSSPKNLLFGTGLYKYTDQMLKLYPYDNSIWAQYPSLATMAKGKVVYKPCHLGILEVIVVWGIPGLFLICMLMREILKKKIKNKDKTSLVPLYIVFIYCLQSEFLEGGYVLHSLLIVYLGIKYRNSNVSNI